MKAQSNNPWFLGAAAVMLSCAGIHAFLGGPEINAPVQASALSADLRAVLAVCWHALTGLFIVFAGALGLAAFRDARSAVYTVLATSIVFAGLFIAVGLSALGSITDMPQWVLFLAVATLIGAGLLRGSTPLAA